MYPTALPFGKYQGQPLGGVPVSYLHWLLKSCKLSTGLRTAVTAELERRGLAPPPPPPATAPACPRCGPVGKVAYRWMQDSLGRRQIRRTCRACGKPMGFAPQTSPYTELADRAASPAPVLDTLIRCDRLGIGLVNDGAAVEFASHDDRRWAPEDVRDALKQCRHTLARLLPKGVTP
jgi:uncharacterized protein (DUF3820 family)